MARKIQTARKRSRKPRELKAESLAPDSQQGAFSRSCFSTSLLSGFIALGSLMFCCIALPAFGRGGSMADILTFCFQPLKGGIEIIEYWIWKANGR